MRRRACRPITTCRRSIPSRPKIQPSPGISSCATTPMRRSKAATGRRANRGIYYPRAGTLGGCTAHNAGIFVLPDDADWNAIAALTGDASWRAGKMRRYQRKLEDCRHRPLWRFLHRLRARPHRPWLERLAAHRASQTARGVPRRVLIDAIADGAAAALHGPRSARPAVAAVRDAGRPQRPPHAARRARRPMLHAADHRRAPPHRHARAPAGRADAPSRPADDRAARAGDARCCSTATARPASPTGKGARLYRAHPVPAERPATRAACGPGTA